MSFSVMTIVHISLVQPFSEEIFLYQNFMDASYFLGALHMQLRETYAI
jgi:hypothetical protein